MSKAIRPIRTVVPGAYEQDAETTTPMENAGQYLKDLRQAHKLTQSALAELVEVGRGTITRLESGDDRIGVGTVMHVIKTLSASPWHYYDLATQPGRTRREMRQQLAVMRHCCLRAVAGGTQAGTGSRSCRSSTCAACCWGQWHLALRHDIALCAAAGAHVSGRATCRPTTNCPCCQRS
jgi:DNA-binding XRE family transcriptional regulator